MAYPPSLALISNLSSVLHGLQMQIHLIAVGQKMPEWVRIAYEEYTQRMPRHCSVRLVEIAAEKRSKGIDLSRIQAKEGEKIRAAIPSGAWVIAMEVTGKEWTTEQLAKQLSTWIEGGRDIALLVGGPEGLPESAKSMANQCWSLSRLTFPHPLVRVVVAEQLYRAFCILSNHPYHRGD